MKARYRVNPDLEIELEAPDQKGLFAALAEAAEIFGISHCGKCGEKAHPVCREVDKFTFYELHCTNAACKWRFQFGQKKDMKSLFPQLRYPDSHPEAGAIKPYGGWSAPFVPKEEEKTKADPPSQARPAPTDRSMALSKAAMDAAIEMEDAAPRGEKALLNVWRGLRKAVQEELTRGFTEDLSRLRQAARAADQAQGRRAS